MVSLLLAGDCDMVVRCKFKTKKKMRKEGEVAAVKEKKRDLKLLIPYYRMNDMYY